MSSKTLGLSDELSRYVFEFGVRDDEVKRSLRRINAGLDAGVMQISPEQGEFMAMLLRLMKARNVIEVGTFTGYSALCMARALPDDGELICCDLSEEWTSIGVEHWQRAGVDHRIDLRIGAALETLDALVETRSGQFDLVFLDADKANYPTYYERALDLLRSGGVVLVDNVLWSGSVLDPNADDDETNGIRALNQKLRDDQRVDLSMIPIGDGLTLARKRS